MSLLCIRAKDNTVSTLMLQSTRKGSLLDRTILDHRGVEIPRGERAALLHAGRIPHFLKPRATEATGQERGGPALCPQDVPRMFYSWCWHTDMSAEHTHWLVLLGHAPGPEPAPTTLSRAEPYSLLYYIPVIALISLPAVRH